MNFSKFIKNSCENEGLEGKVVWSECEDCYQLDIKTMFVGLSSDDGNFWSNWQNKKIKIKIEVLKDE